MTLQGLRVGLFTTGLLRLFLFFPADPLSPMLVMPLLLPNAGERLGKGGTGDKAAQSYARLRLLTTKYSMV